MKPTQIPSESVKPSPIQAKFKPRSSHRTWSRPDSPARRLTFSPLAWLKLQLFLHAGDTEVGGFAVSAEDDPLYVADFVTVRQRATAVTVEFDDDAVADYFDQCVDRGLTPSRFARIWCHTHPGSSPEPSFVDEETFERVFGGCDWAIMFICAKGGKTYVRLRFFAGPGGEILLPVTVDWASWPTVLVEQVEQMTGIFCDWIAEYAQNVIRDVREDGPFMRLVVEDDPFVGPADEAEGLGVLHEQLWAEQDAVRRFEEEAAARHDTENAASSAAVGKSRVPT